MKILQKKVFLHSTWGKKKGFYFVSSCFSTALIGAIRSLLFNSVICSLDGRLRTLIVCFIIGQVLILSGVL